MEFRKSSKCDSGTCVEVAVEGGDVWVRNSVNVDHKGVCFSVEEWTVFLEGVQNGEFSIEELTSKKIGVIA